MAEASTKAELLSVLLKPSSLAVASLAITLLLAGSGVAEACTCAADPRLVPPATALRDSMAVFQGKVSRIDRAESWWRHAGRRVRVWWYDVRGKRPSSFEEDLRKWQEGPGYGYVVHFKVARWWKGGHETQTVVRTGFDQGDCGYPFKGGEEYVVYARRNPRGEALEPIADICTKTSEAAQAMKDVARLDEARSTATAVKGGSQPPNDDP
jgi:hypothetical protein